jgi:hypothetical protein
MKWMGAVLAVAVLHSCSRVEEAVKNTGLVLGPENQMMLIRQDPPSYGFERLEIQKRIYPDIGLFVKKKGTPDFMAEANNSNGHYFIFYYLRIRHAFICRTTVRENQKVRFAGPYPITDKEHQVLTGFRHSLTQVDEKR